jgi:hypothetical protein
MFFKKGKGALWVCVWNQGGGGPKKFGNHWIIWYDIISAQYLISFCINSVVCSTLCFNTSVRINYINSLFNFFQARKCRTISPTTQKNIQQYKVKKENLEPMVWADL